MPELPEVETIVRKLRPRLAGRRIVGFATSWPKSVSPSAARVRQALVGKTVTDLARRGKLIVFHLDDDGHLLVHLRMSGRFEWADEHNGRPAHVRTTWDLDDGNRLLFCDARKFGRITHTRDFAAAIADLGPEPLSRGFTTATLAGILHNHKRQLKPLLLDQSVIAGLGNIYTDEALHRARLHPTVISNRLNDDQIRHLYAAIRYVLRMAVRHHGTSLDWIYPGGWMQKRLQVYGRTAEPCRRCGAPIEYLRIAQRGTHVCPRCQPRPRKRRTNAGCTRT